MLFSLKSLTAAYIIEVHNTYVNIFIQVIEGLSSLINLESLFLGKNKIKKLEVYFRCIFLFIKII